MNIKCGVNIFRNLPSTSGLFVSRCLSAKNAATNGKDPLVSANIEEKATEDNFENENQRSDDGLPNAKLEQSSIATTGSYISKIGYLWSLPISYIVSLQKLPDPGVNEKKPGRLEVVQKTRYIVEELLKSTNEAEILQHGQLLKDHLLTFPLSRSVAIQVEVENQKLIPFLLEKKKENTNLKEMAQHCLTLCGYMNRPKASGIRILSIDGGGSRGVIALECLDALEQRTGKKIYEMFDLIVGVSTGAIISTLLGAKRLSIQETQKTYENFSKQIFYYSKNWEFRDLEVLKFVGRTVNISNNSETFKKLLIEKFDEGSLLESVNIKDIPKLAIISCVVNKPNQPMPFLFRNYEHPVGNNSHYRGSTKYKFWEALLASTAAPTYLSEVVLDNFIHRDGGILINNPTAIALHEARQLWPTEEIQCIVSIGNGKILPEVELEPLPPKSWKQTFYLNDIQNLIEAATGTEAVHHCIADLLPSDVYFRFNPLVSRKGGYELNTTELELFEQMKRDAKLYIRRNREKIDAAAKQLTQPSRRFRLNSMIKRRFANYFV